MFSKKFFNSHKTINLYNILLIQLHKLYHFNKLFYYRPIISRSYNSFIPSKNKIPSKNHNPKRKPRDKRYNSKLWILCRMLA